MNFCGTCGSGYSLNRTRKFDEITGEEYFQCKCGQILKPYLNSNSNATFSVKEETGWVTD